MIDLYIATPEKLIFENKVKKVILPSTSGEIAILPGHEQVVSTIDAGEIRFSYEGVDYSYAAYNGVINIANNKGHTKVSVLLENNEDIKSIDIEKAKEALERAKEVKNMKPDTSELDLNGPVLRELSRIRLAKKYKG